MADHALVAPGETSIHDVHYGSTGSDKPHRAPRVKTATEKQFLALGEVAEAFLLGAAAAGVAKLPGELAEILALQAAHGEPALLAALGRAVAFRRWRADDVRSILAAAARPPTPGRPVRRWCSPCPRCAAVEAGHRVRYFTAADLVQTLYRALADNSVGRTITLCCATT